ncbi:hypothetical protein [Nonomuraea dietziae]|uniref:hypothetical protein n=1 Tax=Nonomuraea dietziae TaxID=65515 RepID=UPI0031D9CD95
MFAVRLAEYADWLTPSGSWSTSYQRYRESTPTPEIDRFALFALMAEWQATRS